MQCPWERRMAERPTIDLKPTEFRRLPTFSRPGLLICLVIGIAWLVLAMVATGWPWATLATFGMPIFLIVGSLVLLTSHLQ